MSYLGATPGDLAAQYREHAALIADGQRARPVRAVLVELDAENTPRILTFGEHGAAIARETLALLLAAGIALNAHAGS